MWQTEGQIHKKVTIHELNILAFQHYDVQIQPEVPQSPDARLS